MIESSRDIERFLHVGTLMILHTQPHWSDSPRFKTTLRGWRSLKHLIIDRPRDANGQYIMLQELGPCVLRFVVEGCACACASQVISWDSHRATAYVRVRWPQEMTRTSIRKSERAALRLSCRVLGVDQGPGGMQIRDLSATGCSVFSPRAFAVGDVIQLSFNLPDNFSVSELQVCVRNVRKVNAGFLLGCEAVQGQEVVTNEIAFFVTTTLALRRTHPEDEQRVPAVLIVDPNATVFERLRQALPPRSVDAVWAGNALDAMYRLRMLMPVAVLISHALPLLPAAEFCRIVRSVPGFERLPLFVFGAASVEECDFAQLAGATACIKQSSTLLEDLMRAVSNARRGGGQ